MSTQSTAVILPVTHAQAAEYMHMFANRRAYLRQSHYPNKKSGRFYFYKACNRESKQPLSLDVATVQGHLEGRFTIGIYAINPESQRSKWTAIDADYAEARRDLLQLQQAFREDGIEALMERSRRGAISGSSLQSLCHQTLPALRLECSAPPRCRDQAEQG